MNAKVERRIELGLRALVFVHIYPDARESNRQLIAQLESRVARAQELLVRQQRGRNRVHAGAVQKVQLRQAMKRTHFPHFRIAAELASRQIAGLSEKFVFPRGTKAFEVFRTAARTMTNEVKQRQELLEEYGLARPVVESFATYLADFDRAASEVRGGRLEHVGARAELEQITKEIVRLVRMLDGPIRIRFARHPEVLAAWESARKLRAPNAPPDEADRADEAGTGKEASRGATEEDPDGTTAA